MKNLSVESLLLIYADFRVKSEKDVEGNEIVRFYSLKDSFDVILNKLFHIAVILTNTRFEFTVPRACALLLRVRA